ncbi:Ig-like domain-containing protein [Colwellia sp. RSH04]|uniref:NHL domain-containing protein n=1 Tax=Colwellia sp. RSH04 TaxID=2305464 RepID=UPI000E58926E|nr:Ig-like domain-containing protein [Colwellia sp. RSH04]RHW77453.1 hypothetical protein D1094_00390 [Colwellia sp. RSH04]
MLKKLAFVCFLLTCTVVLSLEAKASSITLLENTSFVRAKGKPKVETVQFNYQAGQQFQLTVFNGGENKQYCRISSAVITLNGNTVYSQSDFNQQFFILKSDVVLQENNIISVKLNSKPNCGIELNVSGVELLPQLEITSLPTNQIISGDLFQYAITTNIPLDWEQAQIHLVSSPKGMTTNNGVIRWTPINTQIALHDVIFQVIDDTHGNAEQQFKLNVISVNQAPVADDILIEINEDHSTDIQLIATDPNEDSLTFELSSTPKHGTIQLSGSTVSYTPVDDFYGQDSFQYIASDGELNSNISTVTITISNVNDFPLITSTPVLNCNEREPYIYSVMASDPDLGDSLNFSLELAPEGMSINPLSGVVNWVPTSKQIGEHQVKISVSDSMGGESSQPFMLVVKPSSGVALPPNPEDIAPILNPNKVIDFKDSIEFLFSGTSPIQTGVLTEDISAKRVAVVRGKILNRDSTPLTGVSISIKDHPEFGQTLSRVDGWFDMAVNGGGIITVNYRKDGYLPVQRKIDTPWRDFAILDDIVMIPLDEQVTKIDLTNNQNFQVAQGTLQSDIDGERQATLFFPKGVKASMQMPNGNTKQLPILHVRATEYTVGDSGLNAMPGELPAFSAYTYAVELSVDEAIAVGANRVDFNMDIPFYVNNFLKFPTGWGVPLGWYNLEKSAWIPSKNGRVVEILSITNGMADLDISGDGNIADASALDELAITEDERYQLAKTFTIGDSFWRSTISHFTPWDCNWPFNLPEDAEEPLEDEPETPEDDIPEDEEQDECDGCIIKAQSQVLGEKIPIVGSTLSLHYQSDRVSGYQSGNVVEIPLTDDNIPASLLSVELNIMVAGRLHSQSFPAIPNQNYTFIWDGYGNYGRVIDSAIAKISVGYTYSVTYCPPSLENISGFNQFGRPNCAQEGVERAGSVRNRTVNKVWVKRLKSPSFPSRLNTRISNMGSWSISNMHAYDKNSNELHLGTGGKKTAKKVNERAVYTVAGSTDIGYGNGDFSGDGEQAIHSSLNDPTSVSIADNGDIYFADSSGTRIRKIDENGIITTIAGIGEKGFSGDGGSAINATMNIGGGRITVYNNEVYFADELNHRIRKVSVDGVISTVAGNSFIEPPCELDCMPQVIQPFAIESSSSLDNDSVQASDVELNYPTDVKLAKDGTLFIAESTRIIGITPDGVIKNIAGKRGAGFSPDGVMALEARLSGVREVVIADDGSFYFTDDYNDLIRKVGTDGVLRTVAGGGHLTAINGVSALSAQLYSPRNLAIDKTGNIYFSVRYNQIYQLSKTGIIRLIAGNTSSGFNGDGLAIGAMFDSIGDISVAADNNIFIADRFNHRIRRIGNFFPEFSTGDDIVIPAGSGNELYFFSEDGHHLKTLDTVTNAELYSFTYTTEGLLSSITDINGRVTKIDREAENKVSAIITPDEHRTELSYDANGFLSSISNPEGQANKFTYSQNGLMKSHTKATGEANSYQYDGLGRFVRDIEPTGGGWLIEHVRADESIGEIGYQVNMVTAEGRVNQFAVEPLSTGEMQKINTARDGSVTRVFYTTDGKEVTSYPNGNVLISESTADPRFGMMSPSLKSSVLTTPNGLKNSLSANKKVVLADESQLLSHTSLINTVVVNGNIRQNQYDSLSNMWTYTSAEGRLSTKTLDDKGYVVQSNTFGLEPVNMSYNNDGNLKMTSQGTGQYSRNTVFNYYNSGHQQGFIESIVDTANRETKFTYDSAGRLNSQTLPNNNVINYSYDANGNITSITPANDEVHSYDYSSVDKISGYTPPNTDDIFNSSTQYSYNLDKQLELITLPDGQEVEHVYDSTKGHKIRTKIPRGIFDYNYNSISGQIEQVTSPDASTLKFSYDGALVLSAELTGEVSGKVSQAFNNDFKVVQRCVNSTSCIGFSYDKDLFLSLAGDLTINRASQRGGLITGTSLGSITTSNVYNDFGELLNFSVNDDNVYSVDYIRDKLGRIIQKIETVQGVTTIFDYEYDLLGQLSIVKTNDVITGRYNFDDNGNRTHINGVAIASFDAQDRLKAHDDNLYSYSENGDLVSKTNSVTNKVSLYHYDVLGNLISAAIPDENSPDTVQVEYIIDGQNRRVGKKVNDTLMQSFLYKDQLNPIAELDGNGSVVSRFIYGSKDFVPDYMRKKGKIYRIISDHLGSPRLIINTSDGTVAQRLDYDVWGNIIFDSNPGFQPFGFAGGIYDQHTKLTRFGARDYDVESGRWTTKDPIGLNGGLNVYGYVSGDPVNLIDPNGREAANVATCVAAVEGIGLVSTAIDFNSAVSDAKLNLTHLKNLAKNRAKECLANGDREGFTDYLDIISDIDQQLKSELLNSPPSPFLSGVAVIAAGSACAILSLTPGA